MSSVAPIPVDVHPGSLPEFWERDVTFFANLLGLFFGNDAQTEELANEVGELDSYGGRLIPILNILFRSQGNLLVLESEPDRALCRYFAEDLGLDLPEMRTMRHEEYVQLSEHPDDAAQMLGNARWIDGYVTDKVLARIAERAGCGTITSMSGSRMGNNKLRLHEFLQTEGLPVVETELVSSPGEIRQHASELAAKGFAAAVVKSQIGASGIGLIKIHDIRPHAELPAIPEHFFFEGPCMLQGWLQPGEFGITRMRSPSVQIFCNEERVHLYDITEQILSHHSVHEGNVAPPPYLRDESGVREELLRQASITARWLHDQGYRGTASADFLLVDKEGQPQPEVYVCEVNARVTGATYPSVLARRFLEHGAWLLRNLRLREPMRGCELLEMLEKPGHLFRSGDTTGILPINFNLGWDRLVHKGQFLCLANTPEHCFELLELAEADLPVDWESERD